MQTLLLPFTGPEVVFVVLSLVFGGVVKGVTGAGAPIVAIPVIAAVADLPTAVMVMLLPNTLTNIRQAWVFRSHLPPRRFLWPYLAGGAVGIGIGTVVLTGLPPRGLEVLVAGTVLLYVVFRLARPEWSLSGVAVDRLAGPFGLLAGVLQGATGLSAPATLGFLSAVRFSRPTFVATVAVLFLLFSVLHILSLTAVALFTPAIALLSLAAVLPVLAGMGIGSRIADRIDPKVFELIILTLLALLAVRALLPMQV